MSDELSLYLTVLAVIFVIDFIVICIAVISEVDSNDGGKEFLGVCCSILLVIMAAAAIPFIAQAIAWTFYQIFSWICGNILLILFLTATGGGFYWWRHKKTSVENSAT